VCEVRLTDCDWWLAARLAADHGHAGEVCVATRSVLTTASSRLFATTRFGIRRDARSQRR